MTARPAAVAGMFYPGDTATLERTVARLLAAAPPAGDGAKAIIAPHAGYQYSGPTAAHAYRLLEGRRDRIRRVVHVASDQADDAVLVLVDQQVEGALVAFLHPLNQHLIDLCLAHARTLCHRGGGRRDRCGAGRVRIRNGPDGRGSRISRHTCRLPPMSITWVDLASVRYDRDPWA